jgi:hypothetical protein
VLELVDEVPGRLLGDLGDVGEIGQARPVVGDPLEDPHPRRPPDILLTNYVMLELVLTRPDERRHLVQAARGLRCTVVKGHDGSDLGVVAAIGVR